MNLLPNPWVIVGALVVAIALTFGGYSKGRHDEFAKQQIAIAEQAELARQKERALQGAIDEITKHAASEQAAIQSRLDDALERLRNRPERLPEPARTACKGSTGAELSAADARFLVREASRADQLRNGLEACYGVLDKLTPQ